MSRDGELLMRLLFGSMVLQAALLVTSVTAGAPWPQWRGPTRDGVAAAGAVWPSELRPESLQQLWRVDDLGASYSGPIVGTERVFTTATRDGVEYVSAHERRTGKRRWEVHWPGSVRVPFFAARNGNWIRATPALDGERLFVAGMRDLLVCLDARDGKELWRVDFVAQFNTPVPPFGFVCSPLVHGGAVYVQAGASLAKVEAASGKVVWRALKDEGGMYGSAFSSPMIAQIAGREQLVVQTRKRLAGVDPADGTELWSQPIEAFRGMNILTPTVQGDTVFTTAYGGKAHLFRIAAKEGKFSVEQVWSQPVQGYMTSPVVVDGHAYLSLRNRRFTCLDLRTGASRWSSDVNFTDYCSLVASGDRLLALDSSGKLHLLRANPEKFESLGSVKVGSGETWAHLAAAGDELYVRDLKGLTAYRFTR